MFLLGRTQSSKAAVLEKKLLNEFDERYQKNMLQETVLKKLQVFEQEEKIRLQKLADLKKGIKKSVSTKKIIQGKELMAMAFQDQGTIAEFDPKLIYQFFLTAPHYVQRKRPGQAAKKKVKKMNAQKQIEAKQNELRFIYTGDDEQIIKEVEKRKRALMVSAMLRCMQASIENAPDLEIKKLAIDQIRQRNTIKILTQLCASTGWILGNVGSKFLQIVYFGLKLSFKVQDEERENLDIYELVSKAIQDMLLVVRKKILEEEKFALSIQDKTFIYQIARCTQLLTSQIPYILWSSIKLESSDHIEVGHLRTPQQKCVEFILNALIPQQCVITFVDICLSDMKYSNLLSKKPVENMNEVIIREKSKECLLSIIGSNLCCCTDTKYFVMESFAQAEIFGGKTVRQTYLQDIMSAMNKQSYILKLEEYLFINKILHSPNPERILVLSWCETMQQGYDNRYNRIIFLTNRAMYIMDSPGSICGICPQEAFCPNGPQLEFRIAFEKITHVMDMEGNQRFAFQCKKPVQGILAQSAIFAQEYNELTLIVFLPRWQDKAKFLEVFESYDDIQIIKDQICYKGIQKICEKNICQIWCVVNPSHSMQNLFGIAQTIRWNDGNLMANRNLVCIKNETVYIYNYNHKCWSFFINEPPPIQSDPSMDQEQIKKLKKDANQILKDKLFAANKNSEIVFTEVTDKISMNMIKWISFSSNIVPMVTINFTSQTLNFLFYDDAGREAFKIALLQSISADSWNKEMSEPN